jgi:hypothetical protein
MSDRAKQDLSVNGDGQDHQNDNGVLFHRAPNNRVINLMNSSHIHPIDQNLIEFHVIYILPKPDVDP